MVLVAQASSAQEGIEQFRKHQPGVTLMDLRLPDKSGIEALKAIRAESPRGQNQVERGGFQSSYRRHLRAMWKSSTHCKPEPKPTS